MKMLVIRLILRIVLFIIFSSSVFCGEYRGQIIDETSGSPIAFANVSFKDKNIGTISDRNGWFNLDISPDLMDETLVFSCVGYESFSINPTNLKINSLNRIFLAKVNYILKGVDVLSKDYKQIKLGDKLKRRRLAMINTGFRIDSIEQRGITIAAKIKNRHKIHLKSVCFYLKELEIDSLVLRLDVYELTRAPLFKTFPDSISRRIRRLKNVSLKYSEDYYVDVKENRLENVLKEPVYIKLYKNRISKEYKIDLLGQNIVLDKDFLIGFEMVDFSNPGRIGFYGNFQDGYLKLKSFAPWIFFPNYAPIFRIEALVEK